MKRVKIISRLKEKHIRRTIIKLPKRAKRRKFKTRTLVFKSQPYIKILIERVYKKVKISRIRYRELHIKKIKIPRKSGIKITRIILKKPKQKVIQIKRKNSKGKFEYSSFCVGCNKTKDAWEFRIYNKETGELSILCKECEEKRGIFKVITMPYIWRINYRTRFGFSPINNWFPGSEFHHFIYDKDGELNLSIGAYIPKSLHRSVYHNSKTGEGVKKINKLVWEYLERL